MDTLYGMSLPLGAHPNLPLGGQDIVDRAQYGGPTPEAIAAEQARNDQQAAAQQAQVAAAQQTAATAARQQGASNQFVDWPTYLANHTADDPAVVYDDFLKSAPTMWQAMGLPPDQVDQALQLFQQRVPRPASVPQPMADQGILGNAYGALTQAGRQMGREFAASKALATKDIGQVAQLAKEQVGEAIQTPASLRRWQKTGGLVWNDLPQTAKNILQEPQGAADAALQTVVSFLPFIGAGAVGSLGGPVGVAGAVGGVAASQAAGGVLLDHVTRGLQEAGITPDDIPAAKKWIADHWTDLLGDAAKSGATNGAITAVTMGWAGGKGGQIARSLAEAGKLTGAEKAAAIAAQRLPMAGKIAGEVGGLGAASAAGAYAAGDTPDPNSIISQSLAMLIPSLFHAHGTFKAARTVEPLKQTPGTEKRASTTETLGDEAEFPPAPPEVPPAATEAAGTAPTPQGAGQGGAGVPSYEDLADHYRRMAAERIDDEASVRESLGIPAKTKAGGLKKTALADEVRAVADAQTPDDKIAALERLAEAADKAGKGDVVERAQAKADELRGLEPPTEDDVVANLTALHLAHDIVQEGVQDYAQEVATEVKGEVEQRAAAAPTPTVESGTPAPVPPVTAAAGVPSAGRRTTTRKRATGLKPNAPVLERTGGEDQAGPADIGRAGVDQKIADQTVAPVPERSEPAGTAGVGGQTVAARPNRKNRLAQGKGANEPANVAKPDLTIASVKPTSIVGPDRLTNVAVQKKTAAEPTRYYTWQELYDRFKQRFAGNNKFPNVSDLIGSDWGFGSGHLDTPERYWHAAEDRFLLKYGGPTFDTNAGLDKITPKAPLAKTDLTISATDRTLLEQQALIKELAGEGIPSKLAYGRSGRIEFKTAADKAKAEAYLAEKQASIDKVKAALTSRAGDVEPAKPVAKVEVTPPAPKVEELPKPMTKEAVQRNSDAYYIRKMIEAGFDRDTAKANLFDEPEYWKDQVDSGKLEEKPVERIKTPLDKGDVEAAIKAADETRTRIEKLGAERDPLLGMSQRIPLDDRMVNLIKSGNATSTHVLEYLANRSNSVLTRTLARQLSHVLAGVDMPIKHRPQVYDTRGDAVTALYVRLKGPAKHVSIYLSDGGFTERSVLHELTHAATLKILREPLGLLTPMQRHYRERMHDIFNQAQQAGLRKGEGANDVRREYYGMTNVEEFIAEAWTNPIFQRELNRIEYKDPLGTKLKEPQSIWHAFKETVGKLIASYRSPEHISDERKSLLQAAIMHSADLFDTETETHRSDTAAIESFVEGAPAEPEKPPYGEPGSKERKAYILWEHENTVRDKENKLPAIEAKLARGEEVNWSREWEPDTRVHSVAEAKAEIEYFKDRVQKAEAALISQQRAEGAPAERVAADDTKQKKAEAELAHTPHDAIVGTDPANDDARTHIAYRMPDGTYNMYDATPENMAGDPETKRVGLSRAAVLEALKERGSEPLERAGADFKAEPKNNRSELNGWKDGARQFAAFKQADGRWNVYKGDDLGDRSQRGAPEKFKDLDAVMAEYRKGGYLKTEAQDAARTRDQQPRDIGTYQGPRQANLNWWDWRAPIKYLSAQMEQQFGKLPDYMRPDIPALLKTSWANRDLRDMQRDEIGPLVDRGRSMLKSHDVTGEQFDQDITALVSRERSAVKLKQEGYEDLPDLKAKVQGNYDRANAHLEALQQSNPAYLRALQDYARDLKQFADKTIDEQVRFGLIPADRATAIKRAYEFYVPIQKGTKRTSVGQRATGASAESEHPFQRLIDQRKSTILRGYDNMEKRATYELASHYNIQLPDGSKMFDIAPVLKYGFDKDGNITTVLDPMVMNNKAIVTMIDGKPYRVGINDPDFLNAIKDTNSPKFAAMNRGMRGAAVFNALYGGLKTAASPVFAVKNFIRDAATALAQNDPRISTGRLALSLIEPKVWMAALHDAAEIGRDTPGGTHGPIADFAARVRNAGGLIDRKAAYGLDNIIEDVRASIDPAWLDHLPNAIKKQFSIEHGALVKPITMWTKTLENATRMAVFDAAKKSGLSDADAAVAAKTTTVNFEPKGAYAGLINPLYVFANAKLQGTRTYAEKLGLTGLRGGNFSERLQRGNRRTQITTGLGLFMGLLAAKYGYDTSEKDKDGRSTYGKLSDYQKDDYLTTKSGGFSPPMPPELTWSYILGQSLVDAMMNDRWPDAAMRQQKAAIRFGTAMVQTFVPGGTSMSDPVSDKPGQTADYWKRLLLPTPLSQLSDVASNTTTFGSPVVTGLKPGVPLYATNAANYPNAAAVADKLHSATGMNVAPQTLKYFADQWVKPQVDVYKAIFEPPEPGKPGVWERTFFQTASPLTDKNDIAEIKDHLVADQYNPLKKGKLPQLQMFDQMDKQLKAVTKGWQNASPERKEQINERAANIRANTLKRYQQAIAQAEGQP